MTEEEKQSASEVQPDNAGAGMTFTMEDADGNEMECTVLYTFHMEHNDKFYLVYTTGNRDEQGEEVSALRYEPEELEALMRGEEVDVHLEPLVTEMEWAVVADTLKRLANEDSVIDASAVASEGAIRSLEETAEDLD